MSQVEQIKLRKHLLSTGLVGAAQGELKISNLSCETLGQRFVDESRPAGSQKPISFSDGLYKEIHDHEALGSKVPQR